MDFWIDIGIDQIGLGTNYQLFLACNWYFAKYVQKFKFWGEGQGFPKIFRQRSGIFLNFQGRVKHFPKFWQKPKPLGNKIDHQARGRVCVTTEYPLLGVGHYQ